MNNELDLGTSLNQVTNWMPKATLDQTLQTLHRAADYIRRTHKVRWENLHGGPSVRSLTAADFAAITILESAAKQILGVKE